MTRLTLTDSRYRWVDGLFQGIMPARQPAGFNAVPPIQTDLWITDSMKYLFRAIRWPLGQLVIFIDWITRPPLPEMPEERRAELDAITATMKMYQFKQCPFCVKTRRNIRRLGLNIELRDARNDPKWNRELIGEGGKYQVPCLRLMNDDGSSEWLYGSKPIISYLDQRFG